MIFVWPLKAHVARIVHCRFLLAGFDAQRNKIGGSGARQGNSRAEGGDHRVRYAGDSRRGATLKADALDALRGAQGPALASAALSSQHVVRHGHRGPLAQCNAAARA